MRELQTLDIDECWFAGLVENDCGKCGEELDADNTCGFCIAEMNRQMRELERESARRVSDRIRAQERSYWLAWPMHDFVAVKVGHWGL